jgi:hypothetical protein
MTWTVTRPPPIWSIVANVFAAKVGIDRFGRCATSSCRSSTWSRMYVAACAGSGLPDE